MLCAFCHLKSDEKIAFDLLYTYFLCPTPLYCDFVCGAFVMLFYTSVEAKCTLAVAVCRFSGEVLIVDLGLYFGLYSISNHWQILNKNIILSPKFVLICMYL